MSERDDDASRSPDGQHNEMAEIVIAVGKLVDRCYQQTPDLAEFGLAALWTVIHESYDNDREAMRLLGTVKGTCAWPMAVQLAKLMREVYATGGAPEEPR